jgi:hypothetical protein
MVWLRCTIAMLFTLTVDQLLIQPYGVAFHCAYCLFFFDLCFGPLKRYSLSHLFYIFLLSTWM